MCGWAIGELLLGSKLSQVMIHVKVGVAQALGFGHLPKHGVGGEFSLQITESVQQDAELLCIRRKLHRWRTALLLVKFRAGVEAVRPRDWRPEG